MITLISLVAIGWYAFSSVRQFYYTQVSEDLKASAHIIQAQVLASYKTGSSTDLDRLCKMLGKAGQIRITVIDTSGKVLADLPEGLPSIDDHSQRPEVISAREGQIGSNVRFSKTIGADMMYIAIPIMDQGDLVAVLRVSKQVSAIDDQLRTIYYRISIGSIFVVIGAAVLSLIFSRRISSENPQSSS